MDRKVFFLGVVFFAVLQRPAYAQTPIDTVTPTLPVTATMTPTPIPTVTQTPTPTPYTNPAGKQPPGRQGAAAKMQTRGTALIAKMQAVLTRLDTLWAKVQSHMNTLAAGGKDLSGLQTAVAQVQTSRQAAADAIATASSTLNQLPTAKNPGQANKQVIIQMHTIKNALRSYHQAIVNVIKNIKGRSGKTGLNQPLPTASASATPVQNLSPTIGPSIIPTDTITATVTPGI